MDTITTSEELNFLKLDNILRIYIYNTLKSMYNVSYVSEDLISEYDKFVINVINKQSIYLFSENNNINLIDIFKRFLTGDMLNFNNVEKRAILLCKSQNLNEREIENIGNQNISQLVNFNDVNNININIINLIKTFYGLFGLYISVNYEEQIRIRLNQGATLRLSDIFIDYFTINYDINNENNEIRPRFPSVSELLETKYILTPTSNPKDHLTIIDNKIYCFALNRLFIFYSFTKFGEMFNALENIRIRTFLIEILNTYFIMVNDINDFEYLKKNKIFCNELGEIDAFIYLKRAHKINNINIFRERIENIRKVTNIKINAIRRLDPVKFVDFPVFLIFQICVAISVIITAIFTVVSAYK